jgi:hypothetical protein
MQKTLLAIIAAAVVTIGLTVNFATASHEPADKAQAAASSIDEVDDSVVLLSEQMRVSSTSDLILQTTAECSILTSLYTAGSDTADDIESDGAFGQVEMWITIDEQRVPVSTLGEGDNGEVVFCNRAYHRTATDMEDDGLDSEDDFIRTRNANGFNWMAFDVGKGYDADGDNVVLIELHGRFTKETNEDGVAAQGEDAECARELDDPNDDPDQGEQPVQDNTLLPYADTCADAFVGARSLIVEAVHASNHEQSGVSSD